MTFGPTALVHGFRGQECHNWLRTDKTTVCENVYILDELRLMSGEYRRGENTGITQQAGPGRNASSSCGSNGVRYHGTIILNPGEDQRVKNLRVGGENGCKRIRLGSTTPSLTFPSGVTQDNTMEPVMIARRPSQSPGMSPEWQPSLIGEMGCMNCQAEWEFDYQGAVETRRRRKKAAGIADRLTEHAHGNGATAVVVEGLGIEL
ncbi:hypothetical protein EDB83DRAFT_2314621 [Lactarius deliciosus]|nr:hypothetical protein EDB83DRAFT_2314621 [Lactarius deliciosus]